MSVQLIAGASDHLTLVDHADLKPTGAFTIMAWIKTSTAGQQGIYQSNSQNPNTAGLRFNIDPSNHIGLETGNNTGNSIKGTHYDNIQGTTDLSDGAWHHVAGTWDTSNLRVVVDGVQEGIQAWAQAPAYAATNYLRIGSINPAGAEGSIFTGNIAELRFWNGNALTVDQIKTEMRSLQPQFYLSNVKLWLPMDNAVLPATYTDMSGNAHPATPVNTPTVSQHVPF